MSGEEGRTRAEEEMPPGGEGILLESEESLRELCCELDLLVVGVVSTLDRLLRARAELQTELQQGFLLMAKARYTMGGASSVSSLQYCMDDLCVAALHVSVHPPTPTHTPCTPPHILGPATEAVHFTVHRCTDSRQSSGATSVSTHSAAARDPTSVSTCSAAAPDPTSMSTGSTQVPADMPAYSDAPLSADVSPPEGPSVSGGSPPEGSPAPDASLLGLGLRKRVALVKAPSPQTSRSEQGMREEKGEVGEGEQSPTEGGSTGGQSPPALSEGGGRKDPLRWFGVLVPSTLRLSQSAFRRAADLTCTVATLQSELLALRALYTQRAGVKAGLRRSMGAGQGQVGGRGVVEAAGGVGVVAA